MKICFLTHNLKQDNGAGVFSRRLIEGAKELLNYEAVALTTDDGGLPYEKAILCPNRLKLIKNFLKIRKIIRKCDIVHALDAFPYGVIAVLASIGLRKKIIITAVGSGSIIPLHQICYSWLLKYVYRSADRVTAISRFTKEEVLKMVCGLPIQVIFHGVDLKDFEEAPKKSTADKILKYHPYILSVGSLRWRKGYHFTIKAFVKVANLFPDLSYVIIGKKCTDLYYDRLVKLIKDLNLEGRVFILDNINDREELCQFYKNAELFCLLPQNVNYDVEGFGLVFLEAAAAGLSVIGKRDCGAEDAILEGENGLLVNSRNDTEEFAGAIIKILKDDNLKKTMSKKSLAFARTQTWDSKINDYVNVYKQLLN